MCNYKYLSFITGIFTATLLISNTLDTKLFSLGTLKLPFGIVWPLDLPSGIILFPLVYIFNDVLTEVYGYAASRQVIWTGLVGLLLMIAAYGVARILPPATSSEPLQEAFSKIFGHTFRIVIASITAYLIGEFCNSYVLAKIKIKMRGKGMSLRFVASTIVGQALDTTVFVVIAYLGTPGNDTRKIVGIILLGWAFKVAWEIIALPLTLPIVNYLKKVENEDHFDINTNFNPFHLGQDDQASNSRRIASAAS
jgi:uncharacterized integral membrane protein (TIGR00697 family)